MSGRLLLIDAPSIYFRAFHGVPVTVTAPDGTPVNAVRGLVEVVARQLRELRPEAFVACFDVDWRPAFRVAALPSYKAHRVAGDGGEATPAALAAQVPVVEAVLDAVGLARAGAAGYEADDVIGTLAARHDGPVDVLTGDRDLFQLVRDDKPVRVIYTVDGFAVVDKAAVTARYGIPGRRYADFAVLRGDPSDGLPGVPGVGGKTAAALVSRFGAVEEILAAVDAGGTAGFPAGSRGRLAAARGYLAVAPGVVRVATDVALPPLDDRLPRVPADPGALAALSERWRLAGPLDRLLAALGSLATPPPPQCSAPGGGPRG